MKEFFESKKFKVLVAVLALVLGFMIAAIYNEGPASIISNIVSTVTTPIQKLSSSISGGLGGWFQKLTDYNAVYADNIELREELQALRSQVADYNTLKQENQAFRDIMETVENHKDWTLQPSTVIGRGAQNRFYSFTIDKGSNDAVKYLDPVISTEGLVGYISEVGTNHSKVYTILDFQVDVGVYNSNSRETGVLNGDAVLAEDGHCIMKYLGRDSLAAVGDLIFTSGSLEGGTSMYPKDIYVGKIISVEPDAHGTSLIAIIEPGSRVGDVKDVFVITDY